jgi:hypothetical protein
MATALRNYWHPLDGSQRNASMQDMCQHVRELVDRALAKSGPRVEVDVVVADCGEPVVDLRFGDPRPSPKIAASLVQHVADEVSSWQHTQGVITLEADNEIRLRFRASKSKFKVKALCSRRKLWG